MLDKPARVMDGDVKIVDNVFVKMIPLVSIGDKVKGHAHAFDHITLLSVGKVLMKHDKGEATYSAPCLIITPKGISHEFTSLAEFSLLSCIHAIRDGDSVDDIAPQNISIDQASQFLTEFPLTVKQ